MVQRSKDSWSGPDLLKKSQLRIFLRIQISLGKYYFVFPSSIIIRLKTLYTSDLVLDIYVIEREELRAQDHQGEEDLALLFIFVFFY